MSLAVRHNSRSNISRMPASNTPESGPNCCRAVSLVTSVAQPGPVNNRMGSSGTFSDQIGLISINSACAAR